MPGIMYFICGGLCIACVCGTFGIPETKHSNLSDKIIEHKKTKLIN